MSDRRYRPLLGAIVIFATLAALVIVASRVRVEEANRSVALAVDWAQVQELARRNGLDTGAILLQLRQQGVNAVLFKEQTVKDLPGVMVQAGETIQLVLPEDLRRQVRPGFTYLLTGDRELARRLEWQLEHKIAGGVQVLTGDSFTALGVPLTPDDLEELGLGFPEGEMALVRDLDMLIIPQIRWWYGADAASLAAVFRSLEPFKDSLGVLLFNDKNLPGYPAFVDHLAVQVERLGVPVGLIEFYPQEGLPQLAVLLDKKAVRVHSISSEEMARLTPAEALERLDLATRERNSRLLIARFHFDPGSNDWLQDNLNFVGAIRQTLADGGFEIGRAEPFAPFPFSRLWLYLTGLGVLAAGVLLMLQFGLLWAGPALGFLGLAVWTGAVGLDYQLLLIRKAMALGAAVVFPTLALLTAWSPAPRSLKRAIAVTLRTAGVAFAGALSIAALLADNNFFLKINAFSGVKLAFILPLLLFTAAVLFRQEGRQAGAVVRAWLDTGLTVKLMLLAVVVAVAGVIYISRSGNEGVGLLPLEGAVRSFLDNTLLVRPRTKEFLLGYPFLLLSLCLGYRHRYLLLWLLALVGQISLVNTFCHLHIPFLVSLWRTFNGLWLGILLGLVLVLLVRLSTSPISFRREHN